MQEKWSTAKLWTSDFLITWTYFSSPCFSRKLIIIISHIFWSAAKLFKLCDETLVKFHRLLAQSAWFEEQKQIKFSMPTKCKLFPQKVNSSVITKWNQFMDWVQCQQAADLCCLQNWDKIMNLWLDLFKFIFLIMRTLDHGDHSAKFPKSR